MTSRRSFLTYSSAIAGLAAAEAASAQKRTNAVAGGRVHPLDGIGREDIRITDVTVTLLSARQPPGRRWVGLYPDWKTDAVLVQVFTDKGIVGIGESSPYRGPEAIKKFVEETVKPLVVGQNPFDVELLTSPWTSVVRGQLAVLDRTEYWPGPLWAGVDCAMWDIIGKAKNMPVYRLLATDNQPDTHIRVYASGGTEYAWDKRPEDLIDEALRHKEAGYTAFKFRLGNDWKTVGMTMEKYIPWVRKMRDAVGPNFDLMQESNMRLSLEQCLQLCPVLEELKFLWFEEPVNEFVEGAVDAFLKVRKALPRVKVSGGEQFNSRYEFKQWIDRGAFDIVQPDCNRTGITEAWYIARMAHLKNKICCPHSWHGGLTAMQNAALVAGIPNRFMLERNQAVNPLMNEVFKEPLIVKKGYLDLPDKPGFGVELAPNLEQKFPFIPAPPAPAAG